MNTNTLSMIGGAIALALALALSIQFVQTSCGHAVKREVPTPAVGYRYLYKDRLFDCVAVLSDGTKRICTPEEQQVFDSPKERK